MAAFIEILIEEGAPGTVGGVRQQRIHRAVADHVEPRVEADRSGQVGLEKRNIYLEFVNCLAGQPCGTLVGCDDKITPVRGAAARDLKASAGRRARGDDERALAGGGGGHDRDRLHEKPHCGSQPITWQMSFPHGSPFAMVAPPQPITAAAYRTETEDDR